MKGGITVDRSLAADAASTSIFSRRFDRVGRSCGRCVRRVRLTPPGASRMDTSSSVRVRPAPLRAVEATVRRGGAVVCALGAENMIAVEGRVRVNATMPEHAGSQA